MKREKWVYYNYEVQVYFVIDENGNVIRKLQFDDFDYEIECNENYILYGSITEDIICYDLKKQESFTISDISGYIIDGIYNDSVVFLSEANDKFPTYGREVILCNIRTGKKDYITINKDSNVIFLDSYYKNGNDEYTCLVGVKSEQTVIKSELIVYDLKKFTINKYKIFNKDNYIPLAVGISDEDNTIEAMFLGRDGSLYFIIISDSYKVKKKYEIKIDSLYTGHDNLGWINYHGMVFICLSMKDGNKQYLITINKNTSEVKVNLIANAIVSYAAIKVVGDRILCYFEKENTEGKCSDYAILLNEQGKKIDDDEYLKKLGFHPIDEDFNDGDYIVNAGKKAEKNVEYILDFLPKSFIKLHKGKNGICLKNKEFLDKKQEIDHIVIGEQGVFLIETKNVGGSLHINKSGIWSQYKKGEKEVIENPDGQVQRHHNLVQSILNIDEIIDIICISNTKTDIDGMENSRIPVVRSDMILGFIQDYKNNTGKIFSEEDRKKIKEKLEKNRV